MLNARSCNPLSAYSWARLISSSLSEYSLSMTNKLRSIVLACGFEITAGTWVWNLQRPRTLFLYGDGESIDSPGFLFWLWFYRPICRPPPIQTLLVNFQLCPCMESGLLSIVITAFVQYFPRKFVYHVLVVLNTLHFVVLAGLLRWWVTRVWNHGILFPTPKYRRTGYIVLGSCIKIPPAHSDHCN